MSNRLSYQDRLFLTHDRPETPMNIGFLGIFGRRSDGSSPPSYREICAHLHRRLPRIPRLLQRLDRSVSRNWVRAEAFDLEGSVHRRVLPLAFDPRRELEKAVARQLAKPLDRSRPLWRVTVIEGLPRGELAVLFETHHALMDGSCGLYMLAEVLGIDLDRDVLAQLGGPCGDEAALSWLDEVRAVRAAVHLGGLPRSSAFNGVTSAARAVSCAHLELGRVRRLGKALGVRTHDLILSAVAGGLRRFVDRDAEPRALRAAIPAADRRPEETPDLGNRVSGWQVELPLEVPDPRVRLELIRARLDRWRGVRGSRAVRFLGRAVETLWAAAVGSGIRGYPTSANMIVSQAPVIGTYDLLGAPLVELVPFVPLFPAHGLSVGVSTYGDQVAIGLVGDPVRLPDFHAIPGEIVRSFEELESLAAPREHSPTTFPKAA